VKTNVLGIQNVVDTAIDAGVERVVFTSSDKAVNPANTMGTTKLLGERLITAGNKHSGRPELRFTSVRFGNILNSSQSVVPLFTQQIRDGGPVTLTDERMTRFFLSYDDVYDLISQAIKKTEDGEVFVYKMPAINIEDLAEAMIDVFAPQFGHDPTDIDIEIIGRRPGETFHEEIMTQRETTRAYENDSLYAIRPEANEYLSFENGENFDPANDIARSSETAPKLSKNEIVTLLKKAGTVGAASDQADSVEGVLNE
jgi:FlaA1/EpsC-like NDP-sugar epimerase